MARGKITPRLVFADQDGSLYDHPDLLMLCRRGQELALPRPDELTPLPEESDFFLLPGRLALGLDPDTGQVVAPGEQAVAAFVRPGFTATAVAAYSTGDQAPVLPIFSYAAVGYAAGRFWVTAKLVDQDTRQIFAGISKKRIRKGALALQKRFPDNRLIQHLSGCALTYCCPAARNLALGRFEAPLPTARTCNARCVGCLSKQEPDSGYPATQARISFTPTPKELVQVMLTHEESEPRAIHSFGQGCEGEPLTEAETIAKAVADFRSAGGAGTVNVNTNASRPETIKELANAGVNSIRVSINSFTESFYTAYYRPKAYSFNQVLESIKRAKNAGLHVSLNYLFFPGVSDTEQEFERLVQAVSEDQVDFIQLRNMNLDPELYLSLASDHVSGPAMGFINFRKRLKKSCPWLGLGYFNPYLGK